MNTALIVIFLILHFVSCVVTFIIAKRKGYEPDECFFCSLYGGYGLYTVLRLKGVQD